MRACARVRYLAVKQSDNYQDNAARRAIVHHGDVVRPVPSVEVGKGDLIRCAFDTGSGTCYF